MTPREPAPRRVAVLAALAAGALSCTVSEARITRTPVGAPRIAEDEQPSAPPPGVAALKGDWTVDGELVTGSLAWTRGCGRRLLRDVEVSSRAVVRPEIGSNVGWLVAGAGALAGGAALVVVGARGGEQADTRATPAGLALGVLGAYAVGASIAALAGGSVGPASTWRETEALAEPASTPCGRPEDLARLRLGLALGGGRVVEGSRGGQGTTGFVVPAGGAAARAEVVVLEDPSHRIDASTPIGEVELAARRVLPPPALRFSTDSPTVTGGVSFVSLACGPPKPEVCGNLEDDDCDGFYDVGCGPRAGSLEWTLAWRGAEDLDLRVTGPDGVEVSAAHPSGGVSGLAMDRAAAGAFGPSHGLGAQLKNVYVPVAVAVAPGTYRAVVEAARSPGSDAGLVEARLTGRALGRVFRARIALPARAGERAELAYTLEPGEPAPTLPIADARALVALAAGNEDACVLRRGGFIECRGPIRAGLFDRFVDPFTALSLGPGYGCAVRASGRVACWGSRLYGRTGRRGSPNEVRAADVPDVTDAVAVAAGWYHACAVRRTGEVACWGRTEHGELGPAAKKDVQISAPVLVRGVADATALAAGEGFTCAVRKDGRVLCWGDDTLGQLGDGTDRVRAAPVLAAGLDDATAVAAGRHHACALRRGGQVVCWGMNDEGQLGDGSWRSRARPAPVAGSLVAVKIAAGKQASCALAADGAVWCWGAGYEGELGRGRTRTTVPVRVALAGPARDLAVGGAFVCAATARDEPTCWGEAPR